MRSGSPGLKLKRAARAGARRRRHPRAPGRREVGDPGAGAVPGVEIALRRQLGEGLDDRPAREPEVACERAGRGQPRARGQPAVADRRAQRVLERGTPCAVCGQREVEIGSRSGPILVMQMALSPGSLRVYAARMTTSRIALPSAAPAVYRAISALDDSAQFEPALRELVRIRASQINGCGYCVDYHSRDAQRARRAAIGASSPSPPGARARSSTSASVPRWR